MSGRVVVTGARGHVGGAVVRAALADGREVVALTRTVPTDLPRLPHLRWVDWSVDRPGSVGELLHDAVVVHAAAHVPERMDDPDSAEVCLRVNALGTLGLLRVCADRGARRFVLASGNLYAPSEAPVDEHAPLITESRAPYYLGSKWLADLWARRWGDRVPVGVLRIGSVYGARMRWRGLIPVFLDRLQRGEPITVHDGGRYEVDLVHVDDVAGACLAAGDSVPGTYNIGSGRTTSTLEVARTVADVVGADPALVQVEPPGDGPPDRGFPCLDIARARDALGYTPRSLADGLRQIQEARAL